MHGEHFLNNQKQRVCMDNIWQCVHVCVCVNVSVSVSVCLCLRSSSACAKLREPRKMSAELKSSKKSNYLLSISDNFMDFLGFGSEVSKNPLGNLIQTLEALRPCSLSFGPLGLGNPGLFVWNMFLAIHISKSALVQQATVF